MTTKQKQEGPQKSQANNKVLQEIRKGNNNFSKIESELSVTKQVDFLLSHRLVNMEHQY